MDEPIKYKINKKIIEKFEKVNWELTGFVGVPFLMHYVAQAYSLLFHKLDPEYGVERLTVWYKGLSGQAIVALDKGDYIKKSKRLLENKGFWEKKYAQSMECLGRFKGLLSCTQLWDDRSYTEFEKLYSELWSKSSYTDLLFFPEDIAEDIFSKFDQETINILVSPRKPTFINNFKKDLLLTALNNSEENLQRLVKKYYWIRNNYKDTDQFNLEAAQKEVGQLQKQFSKKQLKEQIQEVGSSFEKFQQELEDLKKKLTTREWVIFETLALSAQWLDQRKEANLKGNSVINNYLKKKASELNYSLEDLQFLTHEELHQILRGEKTLSDFSIEKRQKSCVEAYDIEFEQYFLVDKDAQEFEKFFKSKIQTTNISEIKGQIASKGFAKGRVKIVIDPSKALDFEVGDILVTFMTRPDFVPLMNKAGAIVTNEGGITSHAAIVSRELKKPCIIGTKIATEVLKDGQEVEVDANKGIVKILSSS